MAVEMKREVLNVMKIKLALSIIAFTIIFVATSAALNPTEFLAYAGVPSEPHAANAMWIEPSSIDLSAEIHDVGYKFNVTVWVNITSVTSPTQVVRAWQFVMSYNKTQLNATRCGYTEGSKSQFFNNITTVPVEPQFGSFNTTHDFVMHGESWILGPKRTVPSSGSLSWIEFEVITKPPEGQYYISPVSLIDTGIRISKILDDELNKVLFCSLSLYLQIRNVHIGSTYQRRRKRNSHRKCNFDQSWRHKKHSSF